MGTDLGIIKDSFREDSPDWKHLYIKSYWAGNINGTAIQLSLERNFVQLNRFAVLNLRNILTDWLDSTSNKKEF